MNDKPKCNCGLGMLPFDDGKHYPTCPANPTPPTQTPRTDAIVYDHKRLPTIYSDIVEHARTLELELLQAQRERDEARKQLNQGDTENKYL